MNSSLIDSAFNSTERASNIDFQPLAIVSGFRTAASLLTNSITLCVLIINKNLLCVMTLSTLVCWRPSDVYYTAILYTTDVPVQLISVGNVLSYLQPILDPICFAVVLPDIKHRLSLLEDLSLVSMRMRSQLRSQ
jgi:hypothetical protein